DLIFDPQMYFPRAKRGCLPKHCYFPKNFDTADYSSEAWWENLISELSGEAGRIAVTAVATPVPHPRKWDLAFWKRCSLTFQSLKASLPKGIRPVFTVLVNISELQS